MLPPAGCDRSRVGYCMCGIAGFWVPSGRAAKRELEVTARTMASVLRHRGPDDQGVWVDDQSSLALGHCRLSIVDLSHEGHQPMLSADQRYALAFNGEIYNHKSLRDLLERRGHFFHGHSDTEVMLAAINEWGLLAAVDSFIGMFAFGLWDRRTHRLHLVRDRAGEKPLYYGWTDGAFVFGSELKALRAHPGWHARIDRGALALLVRYGYIPAPYSIYENIFKLLPGHVLTLTESQLRSRQTPEPAAYWAAPTVAETAAAKPLSGNAAEARERLRTLLLESTRQQMVADVPLGAFLSGGIDSSLVVALMQSQSPRPIKTFSIGFASAEFNEAAYAKAVAHHLGTDHTEWYVQDQDLQRVIPRLPSIYDEPLADPSQIPTVLLCQLAGAHVKVSLSGDAGDELFGGYNTYRKARQVWRAIRWLPSSWRARAARRLKSFAEVRLELGVAAGEMRQLINRLSNLADLLPAQSDRSLYRLLMSPNRQPQPWLIEPGEPDTLFTTFASWGRLPCLLQRMSLLDFVSYLPDDILAKVDRAAMAASLETRIPLLDHRIVEFAFRLPTSLKQRGSQNKRLLRQVLYQYIPSALVNRPKQGFAAPIAEWLRGPLRAWAEGLLDEARLRQEGFLAARHLRQKWSEHLRQQRDWSSGLWHVLMFQAWYAEQRRAPVHPVVEPRREVEVCQP